METCWFSIAVLLLTWYALAKIIHALEGRHARRTRRSTQQDTPAHDDADRAGGSGSDGVDMGG